MCMVELPGGSERGGEGRRGKEGGRMCILLLLGYCLIKLINQDTVLLIIVYILLIIVCLTSLYS